VKRASGSCTTRASAARARPLARGDDGAPAGDVRAAGVGRARERTRAGVRAQGLAAARESPAEEDLGSQQVVSPVGTRERLLRAAAAVIQEDGWGAASVAAVAKRAGVAAGALYRHFPSKAELFVHVIRAVSQRELAAMRAAAVSGDVAQRFEAVVATYAQRTLKNRRLAWALVYEPVDAVVDAERLAYRREYRAGMAALLREGIAGGALPPQDAELAAAAVVGVIAETLVGPLSPVAGDLRPEAEIVAAIVAFCRRVVGLPAGDGKPARPSKPRGTKPAARPRRRAPDL
jgi:AcrR family transcriptional regulator